MPTPKKPRAKKATSATRDGGAIAPVDAQTQAQIDAVDSERLRTIQAVIDEATNEEDGQSVDENAEKLRAAFEESLAREEAADQRLLAGLATDEPKLQAHLDDLKTRRDAIEEREADRASDSCLALELIATGCEFATPHWPDAESGKTMPTFTMNHPCIQPNPKVRPDNDCRFCIHHTRMVVDVPIHQKRYARSGIVIPVRNEQEADALAYFLKAANMTQARHVENEIHWCMQTLARIRAAREEIQRRQFERGQRGPKFR